MRVLLALLACLALPLGAASRPNIVLILVDDLGYGDLACYGGGDLRTPHVDRLMARGLRFDRFYANGTVCSPTRAALMTGCYPDLVGVPGVVRQRAEDSWGAFQPSGPTLPEQLRKAGYHTALVGKWHLGYRSPNTPNDRGFDLFHGFLGDMMDDYWAHRREGRNWMRRNREVIDPEGHATDLFSQWAVDYIHARAAQDRPFFLYLAYNAPHFPIQPPKEWLERVREREPDLPPARARNVAFIEHLDDGIGRVLSAIDAAGIGEDTLILFSSDNGGSLRHAQGNGKLRGGKQDHWEGGIRVPTCVAWSGTIEPGTSDALGITMDVYPTLCELTGVEIGDQVTGRSQLAVWLDGAKGDPERLLFWMRREGNPVYQGRCYYAARKGRWKLLQNHPFEPMQLLDLEDDPFERKPLEARGPVAAELREALMGHIQRSGRVPWQR